MSEFSDLIQRVNALETKVVHYEARQNVELSNQLRTGPIKYFRLINPGQLLRFPTADSWDLFRKKYSLSDDSYDLIKHTDPIGFTGERPVFYPDGSNNPLNYLRRDQLPPMRIDMTSLYNPSIKGSFSLQEQYPGNYCPFLATKFSNYYPEAKSPNQKCLIRRKDTVVSSLVPSLTMGSAALDYAKTKYENGYHVSVIINNLTQNIFPIDVWLIAPDNISSPIYQNNDCSKATVGCFWFNDGKNGQIELPKDPRCRECVLVRFKKYILI